MNQMSGVWVEDCKGLVGKRVASLGGSVAVWSEEENDGTTRDPRGVLWHGSWYTHWHIQPRTATTTNRNTKTGNSHAIHLL